MKALKSSFRRGTSSLPVNQDLRIKETKCLGNRHKLLKEHILQYLKMKQIIQVHY